jgi:mannose-6-phosphate isomerase-like protein (cupin superfamily)
MSLHKVSIAEKLELFSDYFNPRIVGELNGQQVKLVKFKGEFIWHHHEKEDEMFLVIHGAFTMELRDKNIYLQKGDFIIIPKGTEHKPVAEEEVHIMLFEPADTLNTGNEITDLTRTSPESI